MQGSIYCSNRGPMLSFPKKHIYLEFQSSVRAHVMLESECGRDRVKRFWYLVIDPVFQH